MAIGTLDEITPKARVAIIQHVRVVFVEHLCMAPTDRQPPKYHRHSEFESKLPCAGVHNSHAMEVTGDAERRCDPLRVIAHIGRTKNQRVQNRDEVISDGRGAWRGVSKCSDHCCPLRVVLRTHVPFELCLLEQQKELRGCRHDCISRVLAHKALDHGVEKTRVTCTGRRQLKKSPQSMTHNPPKGKSTPMIFL